MFGVGSAERSSVAINALERVARAPSQRQRRQRREKPSRHPNHSILLRRSNSRKPENGPTPIGHCGKVRPGPPQAGHSSHNSRMNNPRHRHNRAAVESFRPVGAEEISGFSRPRPRREGQCSFTARARRGTEPNFRRHGPIAPAGATRDRRRPAAPLGKCGTPLELLFFFLFLHRALGDDLLHHVRRHDVVVAQFNRVTALAAGDAR